MLKYFNLYLLISSLVVCGSLHAQSTDIRLDQITAEDGLSNGYVTSLYQDAQGFMWLGTANGINRFDGYKITQFFPHAGDSTSLSSDVVWSLTGDQAGYIWVGTSNGLNRLDPATGRFERFFYDSKNEQSISQNVIRRVYVDSSGNVWIGTDNGLNRWIPDSRAFQRYLYGADGGGLGVRGIIEDSNGIVWIGAGESLYRYEVDSDSFSEFSFPESLAAGSNGTGATGPLRIRKLAGDTHANIWVGTEGSGLFKFDTELLSYTDHFVHDPGNEHSLSHNRVHAIFEYDATTLWIGTEDGLNILDTDRNIITHVAPDPYKVTHYNFKTIWEIAADAAGNIWIGTYYGGAKIVLRNEKAFRWYPLDHGHPLGLNGRVVSSFSERSDGDVWVVIEGSGIALFNPADGRLSPTPYRVNGGLVTQIVDDELGSIWLGTSDAGVWRIHLESGRMAQAIKPGNPCFTWVHRLFHDRRGFMWIGTHEGLCRYDLSAGKLTAVPLSETGNVERHEDNQFVEAFWESGDDLWIATYGGLNRYVYDRDTTIFYPSAHRLLSIHQDQYNNLWFGTSAGLAQFDNATGEVLLQAKLPGQEDGTMGAILDDSMGRLWIASTSGLYAFDPETQKAKLYKRNDGVTEQFFSTAMLKTRKGELYLGSSQGFMVFQPEEIKDNPYVPPIVLTDLSLFNRAVPLKGARGDTLSWQSPLTAHISYTDQIVLKHWQNDLSFEFSSLDFTAPDNNRYRFRLEGYEEDWIDTDASLRFAHYTNLSPGIYTFNVAGSNNDGLWNEAGASLEIVIERPWWFSKMAYVLYGLLFVAGVMALDRFQRRKLILKEREKTMQRELAQARKIEAMNVQLREHEIQLEDQNQKLQELGEIKSRFFVNISHEFRTPLTLILGPLRDALDGAYGSFENQLKLQLERMHRNGDRLHRLINQLLDLAKLEAGGLQLQAREGDLIAFSRAITLSFASRAEREVKVFKFETDLSSLNVFFDREKLEKILVNLLSNAFKFTTTYDKILVLVDEKAGCARVRVQDTGRGMPASELPHIFDRFHQVDNSATRQYEGSGIGLALAKELVELHKGNIVVESTEGFGSIFSVSLPLGRAHLKGEDLVLVQGDDALADSLPLEAATFSSAGQALQPEDSLEELEQGVTAATILIVEDNEDVRNYIKSHLGKHTIEEAADGEEGLEKALSLKPDLVISDVMMPKLDGYALCAAIKQNKHTQNIPVILLTAKAAEESKVEGLEAGADDYLYKPFSARELLVRTENLISQRRRLRSQYSAEVVLKPADVAVSSFDAVFVQKIYEMIEAGLGDSDFGAESLAAEIGLSQRQLQRRMKALMKMTPTALIRDIRLERAAKLLEQQAGNVSEIAYSVGYRNPRHFSRHFKGKYGFAPSRQDKGAV